MEKTKVTARARVILEISLPDTWGSDCSLSQVYQQAKEEAINIISQRIFGSMRDIRIIGKPKIDAIMESESV